MVVLFLGLNGFDGNAIREPGVFFVVDGQCSAHNFHAPFTYSLCVMMPRMNSTLRVKFISAMSRYLLPPMSKTTCGATKSAVLNDCLTSAKPDQVARLATRYQWSMEVRACGCSSQKIPNRLVADNMHPGPMSWSHNGTDLSIDRQDKRKIMCSAARGQPAGPLNLPQRRARNLNVGVAGRQQRFSRRQSLPIEFRGFLEVRLALVDGCKIMQGRGVVRAGAGADGDGPYRHYTSLGKAGLRRVCFGQHVQSRHKAHILRTEAYAA